ncbi:MAG: fibronectin-binding domain-containing protein [Candidatus Lokiarchaeota archaeon]|nr:fibronectin-binding domain-containing protein [Candidatus Lokiarchaeota archaeon]
MKKKIKFSNFDVFAITKELDTILAQGKITNVYDIDGDLLILKIKTKLNEKKILIVKNDSRINFTNYSYPIPKYPSQYIISLRKLLKNRKILSVNQYNFDRIVLIELSNAEGKPWKFIIELFNKGNYIVLDENNIVKVAKSYSKYKDRDILANREYTFPKSRGKDFLIITQEDFHEIISNFEGELVRILARNINISGEISEEICLKAGVEKSRLGGDLNQKETESLFNAFKKLRNQLLFGKMNASIVFNEKGEEISVVPFELELFKNNQKRNFNSFNEAVDEYFSKIDSTKIITPQDHIVNQKIKSQEKILENQREYLEDLKIRKDMYYEQGAFIYANFNAFQKLFNVILDAKEKGHNLVEIDTKLQIAKKENFKDLTFFVRIIPATRQVVVLINNNEVYLDLNKTVGENANIIYNKGKKAEKKLKGTLPAIEKTEEKIKKLTIEKESIDLEVDFLVKRPTKKWYEKFRWFKSSDGFLVIGGRDASSNETIFKKYITPNDLIFHANFPGSPLAVIKNPENKEIPKDSIKETADFVASYSIAWKENWGVVDIFYVQPDQVSKTPPTGEFLPKGSFMITGKKNLIKDAKTELALTLKFLETRNESKSQLFYPQILCGPTNAFKNKTNLVIINPSKSGDTKGKLAKEIKSIFLKGLETEKKKWAKILPLDDIILVLPTGTSKIKKFD